MGKEEERDREWEALRMENYVKGKMGGKLWNGGLSALGEGRERARVGLQCVGQEHGEGTGL